MGRSLAECRAELDQADWDDPNVGELQKEINRIEQWCIDNKPEYGVKLTTFTQGRGGGNLQYPWHTGYVNVRDIGMVGSLNGTGINYNQDKSIHLCQKCQNS